MNSTAPALKPVSSLWRVALPVAALVLLGGCASKEYSYSTIVSGGQQVRFSIVEGRPVPAKAEGVQILEAGLQPDVEGKKALYGFRFLDTTPGRTWQNVRVEDVTEKDPLLLLEDAQPKLVNQHWQAKTRAFEADDPALKWVFYVNDSVRVYRFTLTSSDGHKVVLHQAGMVPGWVKAAIRHMFGEKY